MEPRLEPPLSGEDVAEGWQPLRWGVAPEIDLKDDIVHRLAAVGAATVRVDRDLPYALRAEDFASIMRQLSRELPASNEVKLQDFVAVFRGARAAFADPEEALAQTVRVRRSFLDRVQGQVEVWKGHAEAHLVVHVPVQALMVDDFVPAGLSVELRVGSRTARFDVETRALEQVWLSDDDGHARHLDGAALDDDDLERVWSEMMRHLTEEGS